VKIEKIPVGPLATNCYIVYDEYSRKGVVIDPGDDAGNILAVIQKEKLHITFILNTHGHIDHIGANTILRERTGAQIAIHENERAFLSDEHLNGAALLGIPFTPHHPDLILKDGQILQSGNISLRVLHVPGHSPGSVAFHSDSALFSGDVLFKDSVGRTDLPGGSWEELCESIRRRILLLEDETCVYPGHGEKTNIGLEKTHNTFVHTIVKLM